jgi:hypothetical protein
MQLFVKDTDLIACCHRAHLSDFPTALPSVPPVSLSFAMLRSLIVSSLLAAAALALTPPSNPSRRACLLGAASAALVPLAANAEIDYAKIQDLLGNSVQAQTYSTQTGRPTWLTEPTEEFKANENKASDFKRVQIQQKQAFENELYRLDSVSDSESDLLDVLDNLRRLVKQIGGLPQGITKEQVVKQVRRRKARKPKYWPTQVEIA